jgi:hypothetical protein
MPPPAAAIRLCGNTVTSIQGTAIVPVLCTGLVMLARPVRLGRGAITRSSYWLPGPGSANGYSPRIEQQVIAAGNTMLYGRRTSSVGIKFSGSGIRSRTDAEYHCIERTNPTDSRGRCKTCLR